MNDTNLPEGNNPANIDPAADEPKDEPKSAGEKTPEDTQKGYEQVIAKQQETINTLLGQVESLNNQIVNYVRSTAVSNHDASQNPDSNPQPHSELPKDYTYLKDLGKQIGKHERQ